MKLWTHLPCLTLVWWSLTKIKHHWFLFVTIWTLHHAKAKKVIIKYKSKISRERHKIRFTSAKLCLNYKWEKRKHTKKTPHKKPHKTPSVIKAVVKVTLGEYFTCKKKAGVNICLCRLWEEEKLQLSNVHSYSLIKANPSFPPRHWNTVRHSQSQECHPHGPPK